MNECIWALDKKSAVPWLPVAHLGLRVNGGCCWRRRMLRCFLAFRRCSSSSSSRSTTFSGRVLRPNATAATAPTFAFLIESRLLTHLPPSLYTLAAGRPNPDQYFGSPRGDAKETSRTLQFKGRKALLTIEPSDCVAVRRLSKQLSIPSNDGCLQAEPDRRGSVISTRARFRSCDSFVSRATPILGTVSPVVRRVSTLCKCSGRPKHSVYCCEQKRSFASGESNETLAVKDGIDEERISVTFVDRDGDEKVIQVPMNMSMLEAAHQNDIDLEGACEGSLACSTCHVIVMDEEYYEKIPEPSDEENDMLDLAFGLTETSRLGCQVVARPELDGMRLALPSATRNFAVDGHVPKPH